MSFFFAIGFTIKFAVNSASNSAVNFAANSAIGAASTARGISDGTQNAAIQARDILTELTATKLVETLVIGIVTYALIEGSKRLLLWISERIPKEWRLQVKQFVPFVQVFILVTGLFLLGNSLLKLSQENILAITGTAAVALGFAFKDYVSSIIAGVLGLFEAPYRIGDRIQIENRYGEVTAYGLRALRLQTPDDNTVTIPHNKIWTEAIANANMGNLEAQVVTSFYLAHSAPAEQVQAILIRVAQTSRYTQLRLPITVVMEEKIWGSLFKLKAYPIDARSEFSYRTDLTVRAKKKFEKSKIAYPDFSTFPASTALELGP